MRRPIRRVGARVRAVLGPDVRGVGHGLIALLLSAVAGLLAGLALGAITHTLEALPGLLVLVPAAIGMRGNIFGAMGSRLGTSIHAGTFRLSRRPDTVVGQNILASMALTLAVALALAVLAKAASVAFGLPDSISITDFVVISVVGGALSSAVVLPLTLAIAAASARYDWDLDTIAAPLVSATGDVVTLPSLFLATYLVGLGPVTPVLAVVLAVLSLGSLVAAARSGRDLLRRILRESIPVLLLAGAVDVVAGLTIEKRLESFGAVPALLVLVPPVRENRGALGTCASCYGQDHRRCRPSSTSASSRPGRCRSAWPGATCCSCSPMPCPPSRWWPWPPTSRPSSSASTARAPPACWRCRCWRACSARCSPWSWRTTGPSPRSAWASTPTTTASRW
jgi:cation transporter-like permease